MTKHYDKLGVEINNEDYAVISRHETTTLQIIKILDFTPKMVNVQYINDDGSDSPDSARISAYPGRLVKVNKVEIAKLRMKPL